jgi:transposase
MPGPVVLVGAALPIAPFARPGRTVRRHRQAINAALEHGLPNALIESANTKIRLITRIAFGSGDPAALIGLAMLSLGGYRPPLPGR